MNEFMTLRNVPSPAFSGPPIAIWVGVILIVALAGCTGIAGAWYGNLDSLGDGTYLYRVEAGPDHSADSPFAERERLEWLERALMTRFSCSNDFDILERHQERTMRDTFGDTHEVTYKVRCPDAEG
ncbi:MAG: hypothetical protein ACPGNT_03550 [Rhodospirillales bacterium]